MRVLVIEDEPDLLTGIARALRDEGYAVDTAADGEDGLFKAESWPYDLILLDVMLPGPDGWEILRRLRARGRRVPVLMLTARDAVADRVRGLDSGADDSLTKPFALAELLARVRALIRRGADQPSPLIPLADAVLDLRARAVLRNGRVVPLTPREYALVEYLALHRGRVVTRTELYDHLFGEDDDTLSNLLDVHVSNIRRKLGHEFIRTRRGHGYCIE
ncbi:MAG: response regulator transcription factor [Kiritimatiellae bacterium]|nr:response regulator transcription factor [Kiritimatiellia bacterium]